MYYKNPFEDLDKIFKRNMTYYCKITREKISYKDYLCKYSDTLENAIKENKLPDEQVKTYQWANIDTVVRLNALNNEQITPRFFITDNNLVEFLSTMPVKNMSYLEKEWEDTALYIYLPNTSYFVCLETYGNDKSKVIVIKKVDERTRMYPVDNLDNPKCVFDFIKQDERKAINRNKNDRANIKARSQKAREEISLCINTLFYTIAFPESVKEGCPSNIAKDQKREFKQNQFQTKTLCVDERVVASRNGVTPHFRSGYFRHYMSDKYVNVKGTIQFIEATFVKGKAYTIEQAKELKLNETI